jgi:hypothetical protein
VEKKIDNIIKTTEESKAEFAKINEKCEALFSQNNLLINKFDLFLSSLEENTDEAFINVRINYI